jgi:glutathione synthase/RimK-type ligase-like ATP-grasp enzyme
LTNLGLMLLDRDIPEMARKLLAGAAQLRPNDPTAITNLARLEHDLGRLEPSRDLYERALALDPNRAEAHYGLGIVYEELGEGARASQHFAQAFAKTTCLVLPYRGSGAPVRVLLLASARGGELVTNIFLTDTIFQTYVLSVESFHDDFVLPEHDVVFNAIGDADRTGDALGHVVRVLAFTRAPVLNPPQQVFLTGRVQNSLRLRSLANVVVPRIERFERKDLTADELVRRGWRYPFLLRAPGFHAGRMFERVDAAAGLASALERLPQRELFAIEFIDVRSDDGNVRKYRVLFVGGKAYPLHLAISTQWKVHAFSADVHDEDARARECTFLTDHAAALGPSVTATLDAIGTTLGLDYAGVDFGLDAGGKVVVFEANATMAVYLPPEKEWSERRVAGERVVDAMRALLVARAHGGAPC